MIHDQTNCGGDADTHASANSHAHPNRHRYLKGCRSRIAETHVPTER
jgi:hypothetical protein